MKDSARYLKIVVWSEADKCSSASVRESSAPAVMVTMKHWSTRSFVKMVEEWLAILKQDGNPLPPATANRNLADKIPGLVRSTATHR